MDFFSWHLEFEHSDIRLGNYVGRDVRGGGIANDVPTWGSRPIGGFLHMTVPQSPRNGVPCRKLISEMLSEFSRLRDLYQ
jgi:hypothetical protein